jgi:hypothetical protein
VCVCIYIYIYIYIYVYTHTHTHIYAHVGMICLRTVHEINLDAHFALVDEIAVA